MKLWLAGDEASGLVEFLHALTATGAFDQLLIKTDRGGSLIFGPGGPRGSEQAVEAARVNLE
jgi:hypothetical protein